jgi:hypothetical protein
MFSALNPDLNGVKSMEVASPGFEQNRFSMLNCLGLDQGGEAIRVLSLSLSLSLTHSLSHTLSLSREFDKNMLM